MLLLGIRCLDAGTPTCEVPIDEATPTFDVVVVGNGPTGLSTSLALSGWQPELTPHATSHPEPDVRAAIRAHAKQANGTELLRRMTDELVNGASAPLRGRTASARALVWDALAIPLADGGGDGRHPTAVRLVQHGDSVAFSHVVLGEGEPGGSWAQMAASTLTLSPGEWMALPGGSSLAAFLQARGEGGDANERVRRELVAAYYKHYAAEMPGLRDKLWSYVRLRNASVVVTDVAPKRALWELDLEQLAPGANRFPGRVRARRLVLAGGAAAVPRRLGVPGEDLPFVWHQQQGTVRTCGAAAAGAATATATVVVVGAGLSAADCVVSALRAGRRVLHVFRGAAEATKLARMFAGAPWGGWYDEYVALLAAMRGEHALDRYEAAPRSVLRSVQPDGRCVVGGAEGVGAAAVVRVGEVWVLVGSTPDVSFLPGWLRPRLKAAREPLSRAWRSDNPALFKHCGRPSKHPVFVDVDDFTCEVNTSGPWPGQATAAVPGTLLAPPPLHACGPMRGDNFVRFVVSDGLGVAFATRLAAEQEQAQQTATA